jgi:thioesterase domain-containing protein
VYGVFIPEELDFPGMSLRVETLAASYLRVIEEHAGDPPRLLVGFSFGALVAFEMAHQLHARGIPPDLVVMLDPRLPSMLDRTRLDPFRDLLAVARRDPRRVADFVMKKVAQKFEKIAERPKETSHEEHHDEGPEGLDRERAYQNALEHYEPKIRAYPGRAMVYVAIDESPGRIPEVESRWRSLVGLGSEIVKVPGTHAVLLQEPNVSTIASKLAASLRRRHSVAFPAVNVDDD